MNEILQAYADVIVEQGLDKASIANIAQKAGIPSSLIFYYFKNKEDLLHQLIDFIIAVCEESYFPPQDFVDDDQEFIAFVERALKVHKYREIHTPINAKLYHTYIFITETDPQIKEKYCISTTMLLEKYAQRLDYYHKKDIIRIDNAMDKAKLLECMINGLCNVWANYPVAEYDAWAQLIINSFLTAVQYQGQYRR